MRAIFLVMMTAACDQGAPKPPPQPPPAMPNPIPGAAPPDQVTPPTAEELAADLERLGDPKQVIAVIETSAGTLTCTLDVKNAPITVANVVGLANGWRAWTDPVRGIVTRRRFYDGLTFHRVIPEFMIQGGDPLGTGTGGPGYQFANENSTAKMVAGSLAMANAGPNTNGSQFFIMESDSRPELGPLYTVFGQCAELGVVKAIARVPRDAMDKPETPVAIVHVTIRSTT